MGEFAEVRFSELLAEPLRNGVYKPKEFHGRGAKIVNMGELFAYPRLRAIPMKRVELTKKELERSSLVSGDLIFARRSLTAEGAGKCAIVLDTDEPTTFESSIIRARIDAARANPQYLYYLFNSPVGRHRLDTILRQVAVAGITGSDLAHLKLPIPDKPTQDLVCATLSVLDDKVDLNRRMNETLEAMARALFKDWFVDFGPTRAKMEGREPYLAPDLWTLFPDKLDEDGKPEGWEERPLSECFSIIGGGTPKTSNSAFWDGAIPWFSVTDTPPSGSVFVTDTEKTISEAGLSGSSARLVPKGTTIITARGTVGNLAVAGREMTFNQSCYGLQGVGGVGTYATYLIAQNMVSRLQSMAHGSVFSTITRQTFESLSLPIPDPKILEMFEGVVSPLFERVLVSVNESRTLAHTRNLLLPKLMSGEISLKDAEAAAGKTL